MNPLAKIYADRLERLSQHERDQLRVFISSDLYAKLMSIVECAKPSPNCTNAGSKERDAFSSERANARLGEILGWELHRNSIFMALLEPQAIRTSPEETFPDSGLLEGFGGASPVSAPVKVARRRK
jgi:hypothetical protein